MENIQLQFFIVFYILYIFYIGNDKYDMAYMAQNSPDWSWPWFDFVELQEEWC